MRCMKAALTVLLINLLLLGCASDSKDHLLPQSGPTMKQVYDNHFTGGEPLTQNVPPEEEDPDNRPPPPPVIMFEKRPIHSGNHDLAGYTRTAESEINSRFSRLPNPTLVMYVYPHLSGQGYPVPGYATHFTLYETVEYALPGENERGE